MSKHQHKTEHHKPDDEAVKHAATKQPTEALKILRDAYRDKAVDGDQVVDAALEVVAFAHKAGLARVPKTMAAHNAATEHVEDCFDQVIPTEGHTMRAAAPGAFPWATLIPIILDLLQQFLRK